MIWLLIDMCIGDIVFYICIFVQGGVDEVFVDGFFGVFGVMIDQMVILVYVLCGVCWVWVEIQCVYVGEDFYFQFDLYMQMVCGWDEILFVDYCVVLVECLVVLIVYLFFYELLMCWVDWLVGLIGEIWFDYFLDYFLVYFKVVQQGWLLIVEQMIGFVYLCLVCVLFFFGYFVFVCGWFVEDVFYDFELFFFGEEIIMVLWVYCCGYDFFMLSCFVGVYFYYWLWLLYWDVDQDGVCVIGVVELDQVSKIKVGVICCGEWCGCFGICDMVCYVVFCMMLFDWFGVDLGCVMFLG